jgi:hypothetical protein
MFLKHIIIYYYWPLLTSLDIVIKQKQKKQVDLSHKK